MVCPDGHGMVYGIAWRGMGWYMIRPDGHGMVYGMVERAWQDICCGLAGMAW